MRDDHMHVLTQYIADLLASELLEHPDLANADMQKMAARLFTDNTTSIVAELVKANKHSPKDEIIFALENMGEQLCLMGLMMRKASTLDF